MAPHSISARGAKDNYYFSSLSEIIFTQLFSLFQGITFVKGNIIRLTNNYDVRLPFACWFIVIINRRRN